MSLSKVFQKDVLLLIDSWEDISIVITGMRILEILVLNTTVGKMKNRLLNIDLSKLQVFKNEDQGKNLTLKLQIQTPFEIFGMKMFTKLRIR